MKMIYKILIGIFIGLILFFGMMAGLYIQEITEEYQDYILLDEIYIDPLNGDHIYVIDYQGKYVVQYWDELVRFPKDEIKIRYDASLPPCILIETKYRKFPWRTNSTVIRDKSKTIVIGSRKNIVTTN